MEWKYVTLASQTSYPTSGLFCGHIIDPILVNLGEKVIFAIPT